MYKVITFVLCALMPMVSVAGETKIVSFKTLLSENRVHLTQLKLNMTRQELDELMGNIAAKTRNGLVPNPYRVDIIERSNKNYEVLYYINRKYPPFTNIKLSQTMPVILHEGRVIGWGRDKLNQIRYEE